MKRIYLAGPDVFYAEPMKHADGLKEICKRYGMEGVFPLDTVIEFGPEATPEHKAYAIYDANLKLIHSCDAVMANVSPFRGPSADVGTAWEMGYAHGLGKPVVAYTVDDRLYADRVRELECEEDCTVEEFDLEENLMVACSATIHCGALEAVRHLRNLLGVARVR